MEFHKAKTILMKPLAFSQKFYFVQDGFYKRAQEAGEMRTILFFFRGLRLHTRVPKTLDK